MVPSPRSKCAICAAGIKLNDRFRTQETVERVRLDEKEMQFLFMENGQATFMDNDSFEQISIRPR